jgi:hypothetical protein
MRTSRYILFKRLTYIILNYTPSVIGKYIITVKYNTRKSKSEVVKNEHSAVKTLKGLTIQHVICNM